MAGCVAARSPKRSSEPNVTRSARARVRRAGLHSSSRATPIGGYSSRAWPPPTPGSSAARWPACSWPEWPAAAPSGDVERVAERLARLAASVDALHDQPPAAGRELAGVEHDAARACADRQIADAERGISRRAAQLDVDALRRG